MAELYSALSKSEFRKRKKIHGDTEKLMFCFWFDFHQKQNINFSVPPKIHSILFFTEIRDFY